LTLASAGVGVPGEHRDGVPLAAIFEKTLRVLAAAAAYQPIVNPTLENS